MDWQPIDTAPKDGSLFLACNIDPAVKNPSVIYWEFGSGPFGIAPHWRDSTHHSVGYNEFTHWMPLPEPPEQNKNE